MLTHILMLEIRLLRNAKKCVQGHRSPYGKEVRTTILLLYSKQNAGE